MEGLNDMMKKLKLLKCSFCNGALSVPPVMTISKDGNTYKCGRCKSVPDKDVAVRCTLFENLAESMMFPCSYESCEETIPWNDVTSHEKTCIHRSIKCPLYYQNCQENVEIAALEYHMLKNHNNNIHYGKIVQTIQMERELTNFLNFIHVLISDTQKYLVYIFTTDILVLSLEPISNKDNHFILELSKTVDDYPKIIYKYNHIKEYDERFDCSECFNKKCRLAHHPCSTLYSKKNTYKRRLAFDKTKIESVVGSSTIIFTLYVKPKRENECSSDNQNLQQIAKGHNANIIRRSLECPICDEYMVPPIYTCVTGHVLCNKCMKKIKKCPTCRATILGTRNFELENIAENVSLPCVHLNCEFLGNVEIICKHEADCTWS